MKMFNIALSVFPEHFMKQLVLVLKLRPFEASISRLFLRKKLALGTTLSDHLPRDWRNLAGLAGQTSRRGRACGNRHPHSILNSFKLKEDT